VAQYSKFGDDLAFALGQRCASDRVEPRQIVLMHQPTPMLAGNLMRILGKAINGRTPWWELQFLCGVVVCERADLGDLSGKIQLRIAISRSELSLLARSNIRNASDPAND